MILKYDKVMNLLADDLDVRVQNSKIIASNIANVDTPGYKAKELKFQQMLSDNMDGLQMKRTNVKHITDAPAGLQSAEISESSIAGRPDGNNVNIDEEMLKLTENNIKYNVAVQLLSKKMRQIQTAISQAK
jgi:flagellar basal-body rod protein FlgB